MRLDTPELVIKNLCYCNYFNLYVNTLGVSDIFKSRNQIQTSFYFDFIFSPQKKVLFTK
jgi:hypothetical protein